MRDYNNVINERYEKEAFDIDSRLRNPYSLLNNTGTYGTVKDMYYLKRFIHCLYEHKRECIKVLDLGCGTGWKTRIMAEMLGDTKCIYGADLSPNRLNQAKSMNPGIHFDEIDITKPFGYDIKFSAITAIVVLMHLRTEESIKNTVQNIYDALETGGLFLWADTNERTHFKGFDCDSMGFSEKEMDCFAKEVGFQLLYSERLFKIIPGLNKSTYYLTDRIDYRLMSILEIILPFRHGYNVRVYKKS